MERQRTKKRQTRKMRKQQRKKKNMTMKKRKSELRMNPTRSLTWHQNARVCGVSTLVPAFS